MAVGSAFDAMEVPLCELLFTLVEVVKGTRQWQVNRECLAPYSRDSAYCRLPGGASKWGQITTAEKGDALGLKLQSVFERQSLGTN